MKISLTDFVDFAVTSGVPKLTKVKATKSRVEEAYDPAKDFWKPLRERIVEFHRNAEGDKRNLDDVLLRVSPRKEERYRSCLQGYKRFLGRKDTEWFAPPRDIWSPGELEISVNPELGLRVDGERVAIKLYFKSEQLSKRRVDMLLLLLREGLGNELAASSAVGILDVQRGRLFSALKPDAALLPLLEGEAESFARIWNRLG